MESYLAGKGRMAINLERQTSIEREGEKKEMSFEYGFYELFLIFFFWGVAGWVVEGIDMRIEAGEFQNRGFLHMPFCPMYGLGMAVASVGLRDVKDSYLALFVFGITFCSVVEYIVGGVLERLFHSKWWDYSHMRFNVKGRVCLRNAVLFGFGAILVFRLVQPAVEDAIVRIPMNIRMAITMIFGIAFVIDTAASVRRAWERRKNHEGNELILIFKAHR